MLYLLAETHICCTHIALSQGEDQLEPVGVGRLSVEASSIVTSAESRDISENAAFRRSISASKFSARAFIC